MRAVPEQRAAAIITGVLGWLGGRASPVGDGGRLGGPRGDQAPELADVGALVLTPDRRGGADGYAHRCAAPGASAIGASGSAAWFRRGGETVPETAFNLYRQPSSLGCAGVCNRRSGRI